MPSDPLRPAVKPGERKRPHRRGAPCGAFAGRSVVCAPWCVELDSTRTIATSCLHVARHRTPAARLGPGGRSRPRVRPHRTGHRTKGGGRARAREGRAGILAKTPTGSIRIDEVGPIGSVASDTVGADRGGPRGLGAVFNFKRIGGGLILCSPLLSLPSSQSHLLSPSHLRPATARQPIHAASDTCPTSSA